MADFIVDFVQLNESINYMHVVIGIAIYFALLWLVVSIWTFNDSKNRYKSKLLAIMWFLMILIMNLPALLIYIMIRPDDIDWNEYLAQEANPMNDTILPIAQLPNGGRLLISLEFDSNGLSHNPFDRITNILQKYLHKQTHVRQFLL